MIAGREGGARIEAEIVNGKKIIHNYGAGGTGYQASWYGSPTKTQNITNRV